MKPQGWSTKIKSKFKIKTKINFSRSTAQLQLSLSDVFPQTRESPYMKNKTTVAATAKETLVFEAVYGLLISLLPTLVNETPACCSSDGH